MNSGYEEHPLIACASRSRASDSDDEEFSDIRSHMKSNQVYLCISMYVSSLKFSRIEHIPHIRTRTFEFLQTSIIHLQNRINKSKKCRYDVRYLTKKIKSN